MYMCDECKEVFEEPINWIEPHEETILCSPCCKENFEEVRMCEFCDKYVSLDEELCDKCKSDLRKQFSNVLHENFTEFEIEILNNLFDGEPLG